VLTSIKGLGNRCMLLLTAANALDAVINFFKISISFSITEFGGNNGKSLKGFDLS